MKAWRIFLLLLLAVLLLGPWLIEARRPGTTVPQDRQEVIFWHFWGGSDRQVVEQIVDRFNASQSEHFVRAVAMPGNNLDMKLFLAVTGGDPPDLVNQDDPILADWAHRGALTPFDEIAPADQIRALRDWMFPAAERLSSYRGRLYGICNGLDVRALFYNQTLLDRLQLDPPQSISDLDRIADAVSPPGSSQPPDCFGFLPNPRLIWSWGIVFGGSFYDPHRQVVTVDDPAIVRALEWMSGYGRRYGAAAVSFRTRDQSLPGKTFPLLAGRYAMIVDGQWRVRDIHAAQQVARETGRPSDRYGVCALPPPPGGRHGAGWVNGNFFIVPRGARNQLGAWEFTKFWTGFGGHAAEAARGCAAGGWIPVAPEVVADPHFQTFLRDRPLFGKFVELAASPHQIPRPNVPGAPFFDRELRHAASAAIYRHDGATPGELLQAARRRIQEHLDPFREPVR